MMSPALIRFITLFVLAGGLPPLTGQAQLPTGFLDEPVTTGIFQPVGFDFLPDGRILCVEKLSGAVRLARPGSSVIVGGISNVQTNDVERGLLGIAVDPGWPQWPYVYLLYTHDAPASIRILRLEASGDLSDFSSDNLTLSNPWPLLITPPDQNGLHNGGTLRFGPDGFLYVSLGDDASPCTAPDPTQLAGKILRLDVGMMRGQTGALPPPQSQLAAAGNPFSGPDAQLVWAMGFRNPFRFNIDEVAGDLFVGDVGESTWEELNHVTAGGQDYGWPEREALAPTTINAALAPFLPCSLSNSPARVDPVAHYQHALSQTPYSITSLSARYRNQAGAAFAFGPDYEGSVFYADFYRGFIRRVSWDGSAWVNPPAVPGQPTPDDWAQGMPFMADARQGPDGALYYLRWAPGEIRRIRPDLTQNTLMVIDGHQQAGNAGAVGTHPLVVELRSQVGAPVPNQPVTFSVLAGDGSIISPTVTTDAQGRASTLFGFPLSTPANPITVRASTPTAPPFDFSLTWRGLQLITAPATNSYVFFFSHSETLSPLTFAVGTSTQIGQQTPFGNLLVDFIGGTGIIAYADGLGLFGLADPLVITDPVFGIWQAAFPFVPLIGGLDIVVQVVAVDSSLVPDLSAYVISNPVFVTLP